MPVISVLPRQNSGDVSRPPQHPTESGAMSRMGQTEKNSQRAYVVRCSLISRHFQSRLALRIRAKFRSPVHDRRLYSEERLRNSFVVSYPDSKGTRSWIANM